MNSARKDALIAQVTAALLARWPRMSDPERRALLTRLLRKQRGVMLADMLLELAQPKKVSA